MTRNHRFLGLAVLRTCKEQLLAEVHILKNASLGPYNILTNFDEDRTTLVSHCVTTVLPLSITVYYSDVPNFISGKIFVVWHDRMSRYV
jgi:hypothetical protein